MPCARIYVDIGSPAEAPGVLECGAVAMVGAVEAARWTARAGAPDRWSTLSRELDGFARRFDGDIHAFNGNLDREFLKTFRKVRARFGESVQVGAYEIMKEAGAYGGSCAMLTLEEAARFFGVRLFLPRRGVEDARTAAFIHTEVRRYRERRICETELRDILDEGL